MSREFHPKTFGWLQGTTSSEVSEALIWEPLADSLSDRNSVGRFRPKGSVSVGHVALPFAAVDGKGLSLGTREEWFSQKESPGAA